MYLRIVQYKGQLLLYCYDGSIAVVTDDILRDLFVNHENVKKFCGNYGRWDSESKPMMDAPGHTVVYVNKAKELCIVDSNPFCKLISDTTRNEYISVAEYAKRKNKSTARIKKLCGEGRISGAIKKNGRWFIPQTATYPKDGRKK